jgi:hypothetical protein
MAASLVVKKGTPEEDRWRLPEGVALAHNYLAMINLKCGCCMP